GALCAIFLGGKIPIIGGPVFAILFGLFIRNSFGILPLFQPGLGFASKTVLQWSIVFLGFGLSFGQVLSTGIDSLLVTIVTIAAALITAMLLGRMLKVQGK